MKFIKQIEQYKKLEKLIKQASTGTPDEFAERLNISRTQLYTILESMKQLGAPIRYNRSIKSFYYSSDFKLTIDISVQIITPTERKTIYGGGFYKNIASVLFSERSKFNLPMQTNTSYVCR